jgi:hypothetical protein
MVEEVKVDVNIWFFEIKKVTVHVRSYGNFGNVKSFHEKFRTRKQCFHHIICLNGLGIGHKWV